MNFSKVLKRVFVVSLLYYILLCDNWAQAGMLIVWNPAWSHLSQLRRHSKVLQTGDYFVTMLVYMLNRKLLSNICCESSSMKLSLGPTLVLHLGQEILFVPPPFWPPCSAIIILCWPIGQEVNQIILKMFFSSSSYDALKEHVALDRTSWSIKSVCNRFL